MCRGEDLGIAREEERKTEGEGRNLEAGREESRVGM